MVLGGRSDDFFSEDWGDGVSIPGSWCSQETWEHFEVHTALPLHTASYPLRPMVLPSHVTLASATDVRDVCLAMSAQYLHLVALGSIFIEVFCCTHPPLTSAGASAAAGSGKASSTGPPDLANFREHYVSAGIDEAMLPTQPHVLMHKWVEEACNCKEVCMTRTLSLCLFPPFE